MKIMVYMARRKPVTTHLGRLPCLATMPAHQALNYFPSTSNGWLGLEDGSMIYNPADVQNNLAERKASMYALVDRVRSVGGHAREHGLIGLQRLVICLL